jgi:hypothetical protein
MKSWDENTVATKPACNGRNRGMCEPGTLVQSKNGTFKAPTEWTDMKEGTDPICNGRNRGECATATLAQGDKYGADTNIRNEHARSKINDTKSESAGPSEKNATDRAKEGQEEDKKEEAEDKKNEFIPKASNGMNSAPRSQPICNGKNAGECEKMTLTQGKGDNYGADTELRNEYAR